MTATLLARHRPGTGTRRSPIRWVPVAGTAGFALAVAVGTVLAPPSYDTVRDTISVLAAVDNPHGEVMVGGFLVLASGLAVAALRLWRGVPALSGRAAAVAVAIASVALVVAGLNRIACNPAIASCRDLLEQHAPTASVVHGRAALFVFAPLVLCGFFLARALSHLGDARLARLCLAVALVNVALVFATEDSGSPHAGLLQRILLVTLVGLPVLVQWKRP
jgi:hypothetical protein